MGADEMKSLLAFCDLWLVVLHFELADELEALIRSELGRSVTKEGDYKSELALIENNKKTLSTLILLQALLLIYL